MTAITIANILQTVAIIIVLVGAMNRSNREMKKEFHDHNELLRKDINSIFRNLPIEYVRKEEFHHYKQETAEEIRRIKDKPIICKGANQRASDR